MLALYIIGGIIGYILIGIITLGIIKKAMKDNSDICEEEMIIIIAWPFAAFFGGIFGGGVLTMKLASFIYRHIFKLSPAPVTEPAIEPVMDKVPKIEEPKEEEEQLNRYDIMDLEE